MQKTQHFPNICVRGNYFPPMWHLGIWCLAESSPYYAPLDSRLDTMLSAKSYSGKRAHPSSVSNCATLAKSAFLSGT